MTTAYAQGWFAMLRTLVQFEKWDAILAGEQMLPAPLQQTAPGRLAPLGGHVQQHREIARRFQP